ncbi:MAG: alpha/beta hydrolase [Spirochaetales bacterium]|nr:alpha/beta hydrolase [Spirochaetales bacterium]
MKTRFRIFLPAAAAAVLLIYLAGPEINMDTSFSEVQIPESLEKIEQYIESGEALHTDIRPGTEKKIVWADEGGRKRITEYSIIYLHGFTASRMETEPVTSNVASALGANVFYTRLKGHGHYQLDAQDNVNLSDWLFDAKEALEIGKKIGEKVIIISCSSGAPLASWLCSNFPENIYAAVMISPNFRPKDSRAMLIAEKWGPLIAKLSEGEIIGEHEKIVSPAHAAGWSYIYKTEFLFPMIALLETVNKTDFSKITIPLEVFYSPDDMIVDQKKTLTVYEKWGAVKKNIFKVENPGDKNSHIICGDIFSPDTTGLVTEKIIQFIRN